ncbi:MAG: hypothetical protein JSW05_05530 [Candidatus Thorarchaeota archaeon]|nr:MAG: hypothetical protein JSW05_05530 [Candidatus Thorarchaeota archaeon]
MVPDTLLWSILFLGGYITIYLLADLIIDILEDISESFLISPIVLGLLILGIDLEESIVSLTAAIEGLPYLALGNLIGNTVIAIGIAFGLPALFLKADIDQLPRLYYAELVGAGAIVLMSMIQTSYLILFGLLSIILFVAHLAYTLRIQREFKSASLHVKQTEQDSDEEWEDSDTKRENSIQTAIKLLIALIAIFVGAEVLVFSAEELVVLTGLNETFFGLIIMAAVTNVEEFWLIVKSIRKGHTELGVSAQVGKIIWNITLIFGLCSLFLFQFAFETIMLLSSIVFIVALTVLAANLLHNRLTRIAGIGYLLILLVFLALNSLFAL